MKQRVLTIGLLAGSLTAGSLTACQSLPGYGEGTPQERARQGAVIGGLGGAVAGAASSENPLLGALLGGALGAGGGYLLGANMDSLRDLGGTNAASARSDAREAVGRARRNPATPEDALAATTADLNGDGFVTLDELVAMDRAGIRDSEMLRRLEATGQIFELTAAQEQNLRDAGLSDYVIEGMQRINQRERDVLIGETGVLGRAPGR